jgi:hypothetical protein
MEPRRRRAVVSVALFALALVSGGSAVAVQAKSANSLQKSEEQSRAKGAEELSAVGRFAASVSAVREARVIFATAITLAPRDEKVKGELEALKKQKKKDSPTKDALAQIDDRRTKALAKAAEILTPVVDSYASSDRSDDLARLVATMSAAGMPIDALVKKHDLVWFEPYVDWRRKKDVERLDAGWEVVDGAWCDPEKVKKLNADHAKPANAWQVADDVHEVRTVMPLRTARQVLANVASFRNFVLGYLAGEIDLRAPGVKLPIILTATRAEMDERMKSEGGGGSETSDAAALYHASPKTGNPCFVSFEVKGQNGLVPTDLAGMRQTLLHEVTHQILFEYSKYTADTKRDPKCQAWLMEGIAEYLPNYMLKNGSWALSHRKDRPVAKGIEAEGALGWCHDHAGKTMPIEQFAALPQMATVEDYHLACGFAAFLLDGKDRKYRDDYCRLAELVHQVKANADSFATCFKGVDLKALQAEFQTFCSELKFDAK